MAAKNSTSKRTSAESADVRAAQLRAAQARSAKPAVAVAEQAARRSTEPAISPEVAERIALEIGRVMCDLRAVRNLAIEGHGNTLIDEDIHSITETMCERAHVRLDHCVERLGGGVTGSFRDDPFLDDETAEDIGARHG